PNSKQATPQPTVPPLRPTRGRTTEGSGKGLPGVAAPLTAAPTLMQAMQLTDDAGFYQFSGLTLGGNYIVTPSHSAYSFEPASARFENLSADKDADFKAVACSYSIAPNSRSFEAGGGAGANALLVATPRAGAAPTTPRSFSRPC